MSRAEDEAREDLTLDVLVVGAGQAGLATGYFLQATGLSFRLFDRAQRIGDSWRRRYDSLVLFSTRAHDGLPGLPMEGAPGGYPHKDDVADYLEGYARLFHLPVLLAEGIARLEGGGDRFIAITDAGRRIASRAVVVAAGAFQRSAVPPPASRLSPAVAQLIADSYRSPQQVPGRRVLVVGGGATGRHIARGLSASHDVSLSVGRSVPITPQRVMGRDVMHWFDRLGFLRADKSSVRGRLARAYESLPGLHLRSRALAHRGVRLRPRFAGATGESCSFADGSTDVFDAVIWAVGYRDDASWLQVANAVDATGTCVEERGVSPVPGLFHVGRSWQTSRASALLCGIGLEAARAVERVRAFLQPDQATTAPEWTLAR